MHGGVAAGIAQALFEEIAYDEDGNPLNANLVSYCIPGPTELPSFERAEMETPTPVNPLGAKGIGEAGTIGATPAVHAAVLDALAAARGARARDAARIRARVAGDPAGR